MGALPGQIITTTITHLGGQGDGVGAWQALPVFIPCTLPGETVRAHITSTGREFLRAALVELLEPSPERAPASCAHFGSCGGCSLQQLSPDAYRAFKEDILRRTVQRLGYDVACVQPLVESGPGSRRRAEFKIVVEKQRVALAFHGARSYELVPIQACPLLEPALSELLEPLRETLESLSRPGLLSSAMLTLADNGLVVVLAASGPLKAADSSRLSSFAASRGLRALMLRTSEDTQTLYCEGEPDIHLGPYHVPLPPGAFLQASRLGQQALTQAVLRAFPAPARLIDIYAGCGTYTLPLVAAGHRVTAYEGSTSMVNALHNAAHAHGLHDCLEAFTRDLFRDPVPARLLAAYGGAVLNPPRNGALPQAKELAASGLPVIVMVSCNPATFERDAAVLREAGYRLEEAVPIDQFVWSAHLELVATFRR